jgi:hypothetical protein
LEEEKIEVRSSYFTEATLTLASPVERERRNRAVALCPR